MSGATIGCPAAASLVASVSGLSLGMGGGASQRLALYEISPGQTLSAGTHYYGAALFEGYANSLSTGTGVWGGTGTALPDQFGSGGRLPDLLVTYNGDVGINDCAPGARLSLGGDCSISGSLTAATKSFVIPHPDPAKAGQKFRHWCRESDAPGGSGLHEADHDHQSKCCRMCDAGLVSPSSQGCDGLLQPISTFRGGMGRARLNRSPRHPHPHFTRWSRQSDNYCQPQGFRFSGL